MNRVACCSDPIVNDAFQHVLRIPGRSQRPLESIVLTNYFTLASTDDGDVGGCMSSFRLPVHDLQTLNHRLCEILAPRPTLTDLVASDVFDNLLCLLPLSTKEFVRRAIEAAAVGAISRKCLSATNDEYFELCNRVPFDVFEDCKSALVVGFGGWMSYFVDEPRLKYIYVVDLDYHIRKAEMDAYAEQVRNQFPSKEFSVCDGHNTGKLLQTADLVSITGSALGNGTMSDLLHQSRKCKRIIVQGSTAAIHPKAFFDRGVSVVVSRVNKPRECIDLGRQDVTGDSLRPVLEHGIDEVTLVPHSLANTNHRSVCAITSQLSTSIKVSPSVERESTSTSMKRLPFRLHDFTRISWVSDSAREVWEPRLRRITDAWIEIEWLAIVAGIRSCCITVAQPKRFIKYAPRWTRYGLNALPVAMVCAGKSYLSTLSTVEDGKPFAFRLVLGAARDVSEFKEALDASDNHTIGKLLGYPSCCCEFFKRVWVDNGLVDTTWQMATATLSANIEDNTIEVKSTPKSNILWRWMGVRAVSHLPCSFACEATVELADRFIEVGRKHGLDEEMDWMLQILDWPVEWTALHGIAEIKTPVLKVSTQTDATSCKYTVRYKGCSTPSEGAHGLRFPFLTASSPVLTESDGFKRGLKNPIVEHLSTAPWYATDNGFSTAAAMDSSHEPIVETATAVLAENPGMVLDLGCGNGALLKKLLDANPSIVPFGIDVEASRIAHARELLPRFVDNFIAGDIFDMESLWPKGRKYAIAILMPGRLLEVTPDRAARVRARLQNQCDRVLVYAYGDWLTRYGALKGLAAAAGFKLVDVNDGAVAGFAEVVANESRAEIVSQSSPEDAASAMKQSSDIGNGDFGNGGTTSVLASSGCVVHGDHADHKDHGDAS